MVLDCCLCELAPEELPIRYMNLRWGASNVFRKSFSFSCKRRRKSYINLSDDVLGQNYDNSNRMADGKNVEVSDSQLYSEYSELGEDPKKQSPISLNSISLPAISHKRTHRHSTPFVDPVGVNFLASDTSSQILTHMPNHTEEGDQKVFKMRRGYGVFRENEVDDIAVLTNNFTSPAIARALREREEILHTCAALFEEGNLAELQQMLIPFLKINVDRKRNTRRTLDLRKGFSRKDLVILQRYLHRLPRQVFQASKDRASVVIPLCNDKGIASVLFEKRSASVRTHKHDVCFPGGRVDESTDSTIIQTSLREMEEELGVPQENVDVLGVLRCNWTEVASMTGTSVTPVVGYIGEIEELQLSPNLDEVELFFTVSLKELVNEKNWIIRENATPIFTAGQNHHIWGLTAYLLLKFVRDVVNRCNIDSG